MADDKSDTPGCNPGGERVIIPFEEFFQRLKAAAKKTSLRVPSQALSEEERLAKYIVGLIKAQEALLDIVTMQADFIAKHVGREEVAGYFLVFRPLRDTFLKAVKEVESLD